jgi:preprotein translocase subunit SecE
VKLFRSIRDFLVEVQGEFKRVSWPSRDATLQSTGVVLFVTLVMAAFLGLVDLGLSEAVKTIIK